MLFDQIISPDNLLDAWREFRKGKRSKSDVQLFERHLEDSLFRLNWELKNGFYRHRPYQVFKINDSKPRTIHKACVRDRVIHHAIYRVLYDLFDRSFIFDSYSCRVGKGTHSAVDRLERFVRNATRAYQLNCFALKCDIQKFFASIDHHILKNLLTRRIMDSKTMALLSVVIDSFRLEIGGGPPKGLPLGNLTSQLFANIYLNELDQFVKHRLKVKHYIRYTDDFIFVHRDKDYLESLIPQVQMFLADNLALLLHPRKIILKKSSEGFDFLGYVVLPYHKALRTKTKRRMIKKIKHKQDEFNMGKISGKLFDQTLQSYLGLLKHCNSEKIKGDIINIACH